MSPIKSFALCGLIGIAIVGCGEPATTVKVPVVEPPMEPDSQPAVESHVEPSEESGVEPAERTVAEPTVAPVEPASGKPSGSRRAQLKVGRRKGVRHLFSIDTFSPSAVNLPAARNCNLLDAAV